MNDESLAVDMEQVQQAVHCLRQGQIIAYPTESVYGLGCDPFDRGPAMQLLLLKDRDVGKGLILIASDWDQVADLVLPIEPMALARVHATWPGPVTWIFPARQDVLPPWVRGSTEDIAIRITDHPIARAICQQYGGPIIATSANSRGCMPTRDYRATEIAYGDKIGMVVKGKTGGRIKPTEIRDAISGEILRKG